MSCNNNSANEDGEQSPKVKLLISSAAAAAAESLDSLSMIKRYIWELKSSHLCIPTEKVRQMMNNGSVLLKWLNVHPSNPRKAAERILSILEWREVNRVDMILEENCIEHLRAVAPVHFGSVDNGTKPVVYLPLNHWILDKIRVLERSGDFHRFVISFFEQVMRECSQNSNKDATATVFSLIINVDGLSTMKLAILKLLWRVSAKFSTILERYYLCRPLRCIVINCVSHLDFQMFKFILFRQFCWKKCSPSVLHLYLQQDSNKTDHFLRSIIPSEELPVECGGWKQFSEDVVDTNSLSSSS